MKEKEIGKVFLFFQNISVAAVELSGMLSVGDRVRIKGVTTDFEQVVEGIQKDNEPIQEGLEGEQVAIKVEKRVRPNDKVYLFEEK